MIQSFTEKDIKERIDQYVNGQLSEKEIDELWAELIQDGYHLDYLKTAANLKEVLVEERERERAERMKRYRNYAAAAVLALLIGVLSVFSLSQLESGAEVQPVEAIELDYYRSAEGSVTANQDKRVIREAIMLANDGKFNEAVSLLKKELQQAERAEWISELNLNLGSLYYNEGMYNQSIDHFQAVIDRKKELEILTTEKAYWYMGNAYFQLDQLDKAKKHIEQAYELNGAYRRVAHSYLKALASAR